MLSFKAQSKVSLDGQVTLVSCSLVTEKGVMEFDLPVEEAIQMAANLMRTAYHADAVSTMLGSLHDKIDHKILSDIISV